MDEVVHLPEEDRKKLDELAVAIDEVITGGDGKGAHVCNDWPVCGTMTPEEFEAKWKGKYVNWDELPGEVTCDYFYGWRFATESHWGGLFVVISLERDGKFKSLEQISEPDNLFDPRTFEEHIALFDRWMREVDPPPEAKLPWQRPPKEFEDGLDDYRQYWR